MPTRGRAGASTRTATASPTRGTPRTRSTPPRAISPRPAARPTSRAQSSPTTTRSGTSTRCCSSPSSTPAAAPTSAFALDGLAGRRSTRRGRACSTRTRRARCRSAKVGTLQARQDQLIDARDERAARSPTARRAEAGDARRRRRRRRRKRRRRTHRASSQTAAAALDGARDQVAGASFAPGSGQLLGAPAYSAATSSRSAAGPASSPSAHTHHDYPAADIAAPEGTPALRALRTAPSRSRGQRPTPRCGIGFTIADHRRPGLDVLPHGLPRAGRRRGRPADRRPAGRPRRPDRATPPGRTSISSSSPRPPTRRKRPGSSRFAGTAFTWSDSVQSNAASGPVFEVVDGDPGLRRRWLEHREFVRFERGRALHRIGGLSWRAILPKNTSWDAWARSYRASWR